MDENDFEAHRPHLHAVAYRILGSATEADDAVQETWLRLSRATAGEVRNMRGWLTTVVAHVCYDMLRSRKSRREESLDAHAPALKERRDPADEALLADSVGLALLVVLETLDPAERLAFVMHDMFGVSFDDIAEIVGRSPAAARQLASRARRRVQGRPAIPAADLNDQRQVVDAFIAAMRNRDLDGLFAVLDPDAVVRSDAAAEVRGARNWAADAIAAARGARFARPALINGAPGVVIAPAGHLTRVLLFTFAGSKIVQMDVVSAAPQLSRLEIALLEP